MSSITKKKFYYTYVIEVTNPESSMFGKKYYGKHETYDIDDGYFGSGMLISRYVRKHGTQGLKKTILGMYDSRAELNSAEKDLIDFHMFGEDRSNCLNLHEGGSGGHWVEYCSKEEYEARIRKSVEMKLAKTTHDERVKLASIAGNARKAMIESNKEEWSNITKQVHANRTKEAKEAMYTKVSKSLQDYYKNATREELASRLSKNIESNKRSSRQWRTEFHAIFGCSPETFRASGNMKNALSLFKKLKTIDREEAIYEANRFMESIDFRRK